MYLLSSDGNDGGEIPDNCGHLLPGLVCSRVHASRTCSVLRSKPRAPAAVPRSQFDCVPFLLVVSSWREFWDFIVLRHQGCFRFLPESARWLIAEGKHERGWREIERIARMNGTTEKLHENHEKQGGCGHGPRLGILLLYQTSALNTVRTSAI